MVCIAGGALEQGRRQFMQGYAYSVFSTIAIAIHLIINYRLLAWRRVSSERDRRFRGFLVGVLAYYVADASWGVLAGLGWTRPLYASTVLYFLSIVAFVVMWGRFVISYLSLRKWMAALFTWCGYALFAFVVMLLAENFFDDCFFRFDESGIYRIGPRRIYAFAFVLAYNALMAVLSLAKALGTRDAARRRGLAVFLSCVTIDVAIALQVVWPLTPFTALGCLLCNCFLQVFVMSDEQAERHMAELKKALERARAAEKSRRMFFSIVSHDIRTPLNAILGYSELLQQGSQSQKERDEALDSIRASGTTLLQLVNDVLDLAKMDAGKMELLPEPVLPGRLADEVFSSFRLAAADKGLELVNHAGAVPVLLLDSHRFRQILFNLVGNAVKFTNRGSVTVSATYADSVLELSVADTGCGIAPDMIKRVLDPFVQSVDPSHSPDRAEGTGLGLSICKRLVEAMGGKLTVESEPWKGSTFRASIPGVKTCKSPAAQNSARPYVKPNKLPRRVLVVDDSSVNRAVLTAFLRRAGVAAIDHAVDGMDALAKLREAADSGSPHDFVLSDYWMPNMSGLELIVKIRADPRLRDLPVFAVTADTESRSDGRARLFNGILLKPLTYTRLMELFAASVPSDGPRPDGGKGGVAP